MGAYVEVVPPLLANSLAEAVILGRATELVALFGSLKQAGRLRLVQRLGALKGRGADEFWEQVVGPQGLFRDLPSVVENGYLFRQIGSAVPERAAALIETGLKRLGLAERRQIQGDARWQLVSMLEELLLRRETSAAALRCLLCLGEAETDRDGGAASSEFCDAFYALHPQVPLPLAERLEVLKDVVTAQDRPEARLLAVRAMKEALRGTGAVSLRRGGGRGPLDTRPPLTYGAIWDYMESLAGLLFEIAESGHDEPAKAAQAALPFALARCVAQARPKWAVAELRRLTERVARGDFAVSVSDLAEALGHAEHSLTERGALRPEDRAELQDLVEQVRALIATIDRGDFATRLKRWLGAWGREDHEAVGEEDGQPVYRSGVEIRALAQEAIDRPDALTEQLLAWLCSREAQKSGRFAWWLGRLDVEQRWRPRIEECVREPNAMSVFASYFAGLGLHSRALAGQRLDELARDPEVPGEAIVSATGGLGGDLAGVERVERLLVEGRVDPAVTAKTLSFGGWIAPLQPAEYLRLQLAIAGPRLQHAVASIDLFGMWLHMECPVEGKLAGFAWECLESMPRVTSEDEYDFDQLATRLTKLDPDRGFRLLGQLLKQPRHREAWDPLGHYRERKLWATLRAADRTRAVRLVFSVAASDTRARATVTWDLREVLDQEGDREILIEYALEGRAQAELVADTITAARPGFWPIALRIVEQYPADEGLLEDLANGIEHQGSGIGGPLSGHYERCRQDVEQVRGDASTPRAARTWLDRVERALRAQAERELLREVEESVNGRRRVGDDASGPERRWAAATLLRLGKIEQASQLFTREELLKSIDTLGLSGPGKRDLRKKISRLGRTIIER